MGARCGKILDHSQSILADSLVSRLVQQRLGYEAMAQVSEWATDPHSSL